MEMRVIHVWCLIPSSSFSLVFSGEVEISSGEHTYPFNASLPTTAPSSFEGENGFIRYKVRATLDRPWKFDEHAEGSFGVVTPLDLNFYEQAKVRVPNIVFYGNYPTTKIILAFGLL